MPLNKINKVLSTIREVSRLKSVDIFLDSTVTGKKLHSAFTARHPKYIVIRKKTIGVALVGTGDFKSGEEYIQSVNGKNSAAYFSRKAVKAGYTYEPIDPNKLSEEIFAINTSASARQGKEMDDSYKKKFGHYPVDVHNLYSGIFKENKLVAYLWLVKSGELTILNRLLGHAKHLDAGIMYLMVTSCISDCIDNSKDIKFIMYDTFLGATEGLKMFKKRCGFAPYNVNWKLSK